MGEPQTVLPPIEKKEKIELEVEVTQKGVKFLKLPKKQFTPVEQNQSEIIYRVVENG